MISSADITIKEQLVTLLEENTGSTTANLYRKFYADKDVKTVILSVSELLIEFIGPEKEEKLLKEFREKNQVGMPQ